MPKKIDNQIIKSTCDLCSTYCSVLIQLKDGKIISVTGDPDSPINRGALCPKGRASLEYLNHPDRLKYPLKRVGQRGAGKWQQVSWDEALDYIAGELARIKQKYGPESLAIIRGARKGLQDDYMTTFANAFGTPNIVSSSYVCMINRKTANTLTYGYYPYPDFNHRPECVITWGCGLYETSFGDWGQMNEWHKQGTKVIVVDPVATEEAEKADIALLLRPGW